MGAAFKLGPVIKAMHNRKNVDEIIKTICGEKIGEGHSREVYILKQNPDYVVKIERNPRATQFNNVMEWRYYNDNKEWKWFSNWLARCLMINETSQVLIQERIAHGPRKEYPKRIPACFTDLKVTNFGFTSDGRFVCCDYASIIFIMGKSKDGMKYAKWWGKTLLARSANNKNKIK